MLKMVALLLNGSPSLLTECGSAVWKKTTPLRYERSAEMFREAQNRQMKQTNAIFAGFKDIFKDLASK